MLVLTLSDQVLGVGPMLEMMINIISLNLLPPQFMHNMRHPIGKSLMFTVNQCLLYGKEITPDKHISESMLYQKLSGNTAHGKIPTYGKYLIQIHLQYVKNYS